MRFYFRYFQCHIFCRGNSEKLYVTKDNRETQQNNCRSVCCIVVAVLFVSSAVAVATLIGGKEVLKHFSLRKNVQLHFSSQVGIIDPMQRNAQGYKDGRSRDILSTTVRSQPITQEIVSKETSNFNRIPETSIENVLEESFPSWAGE